MKKSRAKWVENHKLELSIVFIIGGLFVIGSLQNVKEGFSIIEIRYSEHIGNYHDTSTYDCQGLREMMTTGWMQRPMDAPSDEVLLATAKDRGCNL